MNNESMSTEVIKVLDNISDRFGIAIDWTQENVMPYLQDLSEKIVNYELITSIIWIVIALIPTCIFLVIQMRVIKNGFCKTLGEDEISGMGVVWIITLILSVIAVPVLVAQIFDITACLILPEKIILEFLQGYIS